jgi:hypothetical protein
MLPEGNNRLEEIQSVISRRIDFLTRLQQFFLDGDVPLLDAQNILALLFAEIARIELPSSYQVAVKDLFAERLQDFGLFSRFLSSQEYVSSALRGATPRERFERFKADSATQEVSLEQLQEEMTRQVMDGGLQYELGKLTPSEPEQPPLMPSIDEEAVTIEIDGDVTTTINEVMATEDVGLRPRVPRVRPTE